MNGHPDPQKADITIVAMTANAFEEDKKNAYFIISLLDFCFLLGYDIQ